MHLTLENMNSKTNPALQYSLSDYVAISSFYLNRKRTYSFRLILHTLFILGMISTGCKSKHPDGSEFIGEINQIDGSGKKQGPWKIYTDSILISEGSYVDGEPDGLWTYLYENGQMKEEGNFGQGVKNGMWVEWYSDGGLMWKGEWKDGERHVAYADAKAEVTFISQDLQDSVLTHENTYRLRIRITNIPVSNLFVEVNNGSITREAEFDHFILNTSSDKILTMTIGYMPDLEFKDFRNLVREIDFRIR
jgi:hypothetical protein